MHLKKIKIKGELYLDIEFNTINYILGENKTGKSTLFKLILYSLGAYVENFISEISEENLCEQVELDFRTKANNYYKVIRKLPYSDNMMIIHLNDNYEPNNNEVRVLNLAEFSDFLLEEEKYEIYKISYGRNKTASFRFYYLLRAITVDQDTSAEQLLTSIGGREREYLNSVSAVKKSIIESILDTDNADINSLRLEFNSKNVLKNELVAKLSFVDEMIISREDFKSLPNSVLELEEYLEKISSKKSEFADLKNQRKLKYEELEMDESNEKMNELSNSLDDWNRKIKIIQMKLIDLGKSREIISKEINDINTLIVSRQVITNIPVTKCPLCFKDIDLDSDIDKTTCPLCKSEIDEKNLDKLLFYKKSLEEALTESFDIEETYNKSISKLEQLYSSASLDYSKYKEEYYKELERKQLPIEKILYRISKGLSKLSAIESKAKDKVEYIVKKEKLNKELDNLSTKLRELKRRTDELQKISISKHNKLLMKWQSLFKEQLLNVYQDVTLPTISGDLRPLVDNKEINQISSASLKVMVRVIYVLSLFSLSIEDNINHPGFVFFDSPKDKDLDVDKYSRFLEITRDLSYGDNQLFITGSVKEEHLYDPSHILMRLTPDDKLLKKA
jgi:DNA repair exonuclease SbcCD ATPase subunit